jgi:hypothetical protein
MPTHSLIDGSSGHTDLQSKTGGEIPGMLAAPLPAKFVRIRYALSDMFGHQPDRTKSHPQWI